MRLTALTRIAKSDLTPVHKGEPAPHNLEGLRLDEFSLVTEPAILTKEESAAHAGLTVVKSATKGVPESIAKSITPNQGEDFYAAIGRLVKACRLALMAETGDQETYWWYPVKVFGDHVLMGDIWADPMDSVSTDQVAYYKCHYTQVEGGAFSVSKVTGTKLQLVDVELQQQKNLEPPVEAAPAVEQAPEPTIELTEAEKAAKKPEPDKADGAMQHEPMPGMPGMAAKSEDAPPAAEPAVESAPVEAEKGTTPKPDEMDGAMQAEHMPAMPGMGMMAKSVDVAAITKGLAGQRYTMKVAADGTLQVEVGDPAPAVALAAPDEVQKQLDAIRDEREVLRKQLDEQRVKLAKMEAADPAGNPIVKNSNPSQPQATAAWDNYMAFAMAQTHVI